MAINILNNNQINLSNELLYNEFTNISIYDRNHIKFDYILSSESNNESEYNHIYILGSIKTDELSNSKKETIVTIETDEDTYKFKLIQTELEEKLLNYLYDTDSFRVGEDLYKTLDKLGIPYEDILKNERDIKQKNKVIGYIKIADNIYVRIVEKKQNEKAKYIFAGIGILLLIMLICQFASKPKIENIQPEKKIDLEIAEASQWDGSMPQNGESSNEETGEIEIPGYANLYVSEQKPSIQLINPSSNDVYFIYKITEGEDVIYETKALEPDKVIEVNMVDLLSKGEHECIFEISCYDIETQTSCNGAVQTVKINVQ